MEARPLLEPVAKPQTPLPKAQLAALCIARLVEPIAFTQLFPYVNELMSDLHVTDDPARVGFYSGLVESAFAVAQLSTIYYWARLSDIVGRRPVILWGILVTALTTVVFGLSKSFAAVLIARCIGGLSSGNLPVIQSMLGEITDATNQATAFPIFSLTWPLGSTIGPLIGGSFSYPATKYPQFFDNDFWREYPYLLPCLVAAIIALFGVGFAYVILDETLPSKRKQRSDEFTALSSGAEGFDSSADRPMELRQLLSLPIIRALAMSGFALGFVVTSFDVVFVLFCYTSVHSGGLSFSASQIGYSLATSGAISVAFQIFMMPYLLRTFDCAKMNSFCMGLLPYTYAALPILNLIACHGIDGETGQLDAYSTAILWIGIAIVLTLSRATVLSYGIILILVKENAPSPASLGQSNGIVQFFMCFSRALAPFFVSSLFTLSIDNNILGGYLWAVVMVFLSYYGKAISRQISLHSRQTIH